MSVTEMRPDFRPTSIFTEGKSIIEDFKQNPTNYSAEQRAIFETGMFLNLSVNSDGENTQIASLSRGLVWDRVTPPHEMLAAIIEDIGGKKVEESDWTGDHSLGVTYEVEELDLDRLVLSFVYSPASRYQEYMEHLADLAKLSDEVHAESILTGPNAKGRTFRQIVNGENTNLIRAFQKGSGAGFVWNSEKTVNEEGEIDWNALPPVGEEPYSVRRLATSTGTEEEIIRNILEGLDYFNGSGKKIRIRISAFFDDSVECCVNSGAAQITSLTTSDNAAWSIKTDIPVSTTKTVGSSGINMNVSTTSTTGSAESSKCRACGKQKFRKEENKCNCGQKDKNN